MGKIENLLDEQTIKTLGENGEKIIKEIEGIKKALSESKEREYLISKLAYLNFSISGLYHEELEKGQLLEEVPVKNIIFETKFED